MPVDTTAVGKAYPPVVYAVGREKIREYARATGESEPLYLDLDAARAAGHIDLVAPPMFVVVYSAPAIAQAIVDPELAINFAMLVHGSQEFRWGDLVFAGDEITTMTTVKEIRESAGLGFYIFETVSTNQDGAEVCTGTWTDIVRGV